MTFCLWVVCMRGRETEGNIKRLKGLTAREQGNVFFFFLSSAPLDLLSYFSQLFCSISLFLSNCCRGVFRTNMNAEGMTEILYFLLLLFMWFFAFCTFCSTLFLLYFFSFVSNTCLMISDKACHWNALCKALLPLQNAVRRRSHCWMCN